MDESLALIPCVLIIIKLFEVVLTCKSVVKTSVQCKLLFMLSMLALIIGFAMRLLK